MNKRKQNKGAVALSFDTRMGSAPRITAKGKGKLADKIIELAKENHIHIHNDPDLLEMLSQLDLKKEIPESLYEIVAQLLAFIYLLNTEESKK